MKTHRLTAAMVLGLAASMSGARAEAVLGDCAWSEPTPEVRGLRATIGPAGEALDIVCTANAGATVRLMTVSAPPVTGPRYAIRGKLRHDDVRGEAYLEMLSVFPGGKQFFTRTKARAGVLGFITGTSDWRAFTLPFDATGLADAPEALIVNLVLPGPGRLTFSTAEIVQYAPGDDPLRAPGQWWGERQGGLLGGLAGAALGICGGLIGVLAGRGKAPGFVMALLSLFTGLGVVALIAGVVALLQHQPYAVFFPLLLLGVLATSICGGMLPVVRRRYAERELRKLEAADAA